MKRFLLLNAVAATLVVTGFSFTQTAPKQEGITASIKRGEEVFTQLCLGCHQANGSGVPSLNPPLIKTKWVLGDKRELVKIILNGMTGEIVVNGETYNNEMPAQNFLTDQQAADVLTYIRNSFGNKATAVKPAEVKAVRAKLKIT